MLVQPAGIQPWAILQVTVKPTPNAQAGAFNPNRALPNGLQLADLFTRPSATGDLPFDLWPALSFGRVSIQGSVVLGPFPAIRQDGEPATTDDWDGMNGNTRSEKVFSGIRGAIKAGVNLAPFWGVVVVPDYQIDSFGSYGWVNVPGISRPMGRTLLDYNDLTSAHTMHEMGHGFAFDHSCGEFNPDPGGDYGDPSDVMSYARCMSFQATDGTTGPGFSAASLWLRGWLPPDYTFIDAPAGIADATYTLSPLYASPLAPGASRALVVGVPRAGRYVDREIFFVEFRDGSGIDAGMPAPAVFVHLVRSQQGEWNNRPWLVGPNATSPAADAQGLVVGGGGWIDQEAGFGVGVEAIDPVANTARVRIIPAVATISVTIDKQTVDETEIGFDVEEWPGVIFVRNPECAPREFDYLVLSRREEITLVASPGGGLDSNHQVRWSVKGVPVTASGPLSFDLTYETPHRTITLDVDLNGHTLVLRNRPDEGTIKFYVEVFADPPVPGVGASITNLQFDGRGRRYEDPQHDAIVERCEREGADILRSFYERFVLVRVPAPGEPVQYLGDPQIKEMIDVIQWAGKQIRPE